MVYPSLLICAQSRRVEWHRKSSTIRSVRGEFTKGCWAHCGRMTPDAFFMYFCAAGEDIVKLNSDRG